MWKEELNGDGGEIATVLLLLLLLRPFCVIGDKKPNSPTSSFSEKNKTKKPSVGLKKSCQSSTQEVPRNTLF